MTFPVVAASSTSAQGLLTSHTVALPAGIANGDLLVAAIGLSEGGATFDWPTGWTELADTAISVGGQDVSFSSAYRVANGSEGASLSVTSSGSGRSAHQTWRITGANSTPEIATATGGNTTGAASLPSLAPSWGAADTLWLAVLATSAPRSHSAYPSNYTNGTNTQTGSTATHVALRTAQRELNAASEDPGSFTFGATSTSWVVATIAIQPAAASGDATVGATGRTGATAIGTVSVALGMPAAAVGVGAIGAVGSPSLAFDLAATLTGVSGAGEAGLVAAVALDPTDIAGGVGDGQVGVVEIILDSAALPVQSALASALGTILVRVSGWSPAGAAAAVWVETTGLDENWAEMPPTDVAWPVAAAVSDAWTPAPGANGEWSA